MTSRVPLRTISGSRRWRAGHEVSNRIRRSTVTASFAPRSPYGSDPGQLGAPGRHKQPPGTITQLLLTQSMPSENVTPMSMSVTLEMRAARHAALGDPVRLAIVDELSVSDRAPVELRRRLGIESNLLAHHLDVLERVGLIERSRSSGDGRRRYVHLVPDALEGLAPGRQIRVRRRAVRVHRELGALATGGRAVARGHRRAGRVGGHPSRRARPPRRRGGRPPGRARSRRSHTP